MVSLSEIVRTALVYVEWHVQFDPANERKNECSDRDLARTMYYAVFHVAKNYAMSKDSQFPQSASHERVWTWFENENLWVISNQANELKAARKIADYRLDKDFVFKRKKVLKITFDIIEQLDPELLEECKQGLDFGSDFVQEQLNLPNTS
jgi:uncharacterized protein (UPF0332 family)